MNSTCSEYRVQNVIKFAFGNNDGIDKYCYQSPLQITKIFKDLFTATKNPIKWSILIEIMLEIFWFFILLVFNLIPLHYCVLSVYC